MLNIFRAIHLVSLRLPAYISLYDGTCTLVGGGSKLGEYRDCNTPNVGTMTEIWTKVKRPNNL